jgi:hypothetical protein
MTFEEWWNRDRRLVKDMKKVARAAYEQGYREGSRKSTGYLTAEEKDKQHIEDLNHASWTKF